MARQTMITIETVSLLFLRGRRSRREWCRECGIEREMIALENVSVLSSLEWQELEDGLGSSGLHRLQSPDGETLICLHSLLALVQKTKLR